MEVIAPGIYRLPNGRYRVVVTIGASRDGARPREKRYPPNTSVRKMQAWQEEQRVEMRREGMKPVLGTLAADVTRYLALPAIKSLPSFKSRKADANAWVPVWGHLRRDELDVKQIQSQVDAWVKGDIAPWTVRHRIHALRHLYKLLDGTRARNPVLAVKAPPKPRMIPRARDYDDICTTFNQMRPSATKAFLMIMAFCGFRPAEVKRTELWMVKTDADAPHVIRNTAKGGDVVVVPLSPEGKLAWTMFTERGGFSKTTRRPRTFPNANRDWRAAMVRAKLDPTRCYDLVHSYCTQLLIAGGGDISLVQKARGHRDIRTTMIYTQVVVDPRLAIAVNKAFGRHASRHAKPAAMPETMPKKTPGGP